MVENNEQYDHYAQTEFPKQMPPDIDDELEFSIRQKIEKRIRLVEVFGKIAYLIATVSIIVAIAVFEPTSVIMSLAFGVLIVPLAFIGIHLANDSKQLNVIKDTGVVHVYQHKMRQARSVCVSCLVVWGGGMVLFIIIFGGEIVPR